MSRLPVIVGFGGVNPAGRVSGHNAYRRMVIDALAPSVADQTYQSLATLMSLEGDATAASTQTFIRDHTLVRRIEHFDLDRIPLQRSATLRASAGGAISFELRKRDLPDNPPPNWTVGVIDAQRVLVTVQGEAECLFPDTRIGKVSSAGQLPTGFLPEKQYAARSHPRGLQLAIWGASDALRSIGVPWEDLKSRLSPDAFSTYAASAMGQLDFDGYAGLFQSHLMGKRPSSKQLALGLTDMPADFVNAYVLGSVGCTGANVGACATFLYNLRLAADDIRSGRRRVSFVGNAEAPITAEVIEGYRTMGALAEDEALMALDGRKDQPDCRRAVRPFSDNCGFTLSESSVFVMVMDEELAMELGMTIFGSVADVFINADGYKKSIPGPGIGNYLTMAKALATAETILGSDNLRRKTYIQAHGTSTPQNRVTESHIMSELAGIFGIEQWIVSACKAYLGHSLAPASGDQLATSLGVWEHGWIPGITTIDHIAADVHQENLRFSNKHIEVGPEGMDAVLINSKGFGGNNATAVILSPKVTERMLVKRHGQSNWNAYRARNESVRQAQAEYDAGMRRALQAPIYLFGEGVVEGHELSISREKIRIPGFAHPVSLQIEHPFPDMDIK